MIIGFNKKDCKTLSKGNNPKMRLLYIPNGMKFCSSCSTVKSRRKEFRRGQKKDGKYIGDGYMAVCRDCACEANREYREAHLQQQREYFHQWYQANLEYCRARSIKWRREHPEEAFAAQINGRIRASRRNRQTAEAKAKSIAERVKRSRARYAARMK